jgi:catechol-2,3-dioxygenase
MSEHADLVAALAQLGERLPAPPSGLVDRALGAVSEIDAPPRCDLDHLHLETANLDRARAFYQRWFRFEGGTIVDETLFVHNPDGFLLCLTPATEVQPLPHGVHFGFTMPSAAAVGLMWEAMRTEGVATDELHRSDGFASFHCADPDGRSIELFWEAPATAPDPSSV